MAIYLFIVWHARFATAPFKNILFCLQKVIDYFQLWFLYESDWRIFFSSRYHPHGYSDWSLKGVIVNQTCQDLNGGSLKNSFKLLNNCIKEHYLVFLRKFRVSNSRSNILKEFRYVLHLFKYAYLCAMLLTKMCLFCLAVFFNLHFLDWIRKK